MNVTAVLVDIVVMVLVAIVFMVILTAFVRRVLGAQVGIGRIVVAGILGLGAEVGFESQFVWKQGSYTPALIPVQLGIIVLVAVAFLVLAELLVPAGSFPRPTEWIPSMRRRSQRTKRYAQITRIALRAGLLPFRPDTDPSSAGSVERRRQAVALRTALEEAGGAFVKLGQVLSTRSDLLPVEYLTELSHLQQRVPAAEWDQVRALLETELGGLVETFFASFEETPLAAASIGQVHRATLLGGEAVAVKVQRPGIIPLIERDVDILLRIAKQLESSTRWAKDLGVAELARGFSDSLREEVDYRVEASNMAAMTHTQQAHPVEERLIIPRHFPRLCTSRVLVMELVAGRTLSDDDALTGVSDAQRVRQSALLFRSTLTQIMDDGVFHADLHPGNIMVTPAGALVLLDFGSIGRLDSEIRGQIGNLLLAFYRSDSRAFADALLAFVELPDDVDEFALRRQLGMFMATQLGPGASIDVTVFTEMIRLLAANRVALPAELASSLRAIGTLEGTLRHLSPSFDFLAEAGDFAQARIAQLQTPSGMFSAAKTELDSLLPLLRRLPARVDQLTGVLASGRFGMNVRLFADRRDRTLVRELVSTLAVTFLAGVFGIMAAMLLISDGGPVITPTLSLFQIFGYLLVVVSGMLTLKVVFDVFRLRRNP
ncbi:ABC1 kinase family protein [Microbacterium panaciterrae]|uniref:AarF/UbiB family protein n=1 Tax=Microbacterium panaciterrae TaxID=985759 RepID=A0ABP8P641_9MICO